MADPSSFRLSLHGLPYSETVASKPPKLLTSLSDTKSSDSLHDNSPATDTPQLRNHGDHPTSSPLQESQHSLNTTAPAHSSLSSVPSIPQIRVEDEREKTAEKRWLSLRQTKSKPDEPQTQQPFRGIAMDIPSGDLSEELSPESLKFSKRGSMLVDGKRTAPPNGRKQLGSTLQPIPDKPMPRSASRAQARASARILSTDEEVLSEKVRSYYAFGAETAYDSDARSSIANKIGARWQDTLGSKTEASSVASLSRATSTNDVHEDVQSQINGARSVSGTIREETELAGGIEDWQDVDNANVDRYGFIIPKPEPPNGVNRSGTVKNSQHLTRVSTSLQIASETPRRKNTARRAPSSAHGRTSPTMHASPSEKSLRRPRTSQGGNLSRHTTFRGKDRKLMDTAADMLTLPRTASQLRATGQPASEDPRARRKEIEREEKWRRMAIPASTNQHGGGMAFTFNINDPKLIERTWKGIPDKWRATAWHAFLSSSAKKRKDSLSDEDLIVAFEEYQSESSPDDVQIDIDVPRTISSHIMFRRRYRGGQRLLFRVLHAMSLHFADTGYVQGMAALAATLLAYYEEEKAFVMLVRLWELRGLGKLYKSGFGGLMTALDDFEKQWLGSGELAKKLVS